MAYKNHGAGCKIVDGHFVRDSSLLPFNGKNLDDYVDDEDRERAAAEPERTKGGTAYRRPAQTTGLTLNNMPEYQDAISESVKNDIIAYDAILGVLRSTSDPARLPLSSMGNLNIYATAYSDHHHLTEDINKTQPERFYVSKAGVEIEAAIYKARRESGKVVESLAKMLKLHDLKREVRTRSKAKKPDGDQPEV